MAEALGWEEDAGNMVMCTTSLHIMPCSSTETLENGTAFLPKSLTPTFLTYYNYSLIPVITSDGLPSSQRPSKTSTARSDTSLALALRFAALKTSISSSTSWILITQENQNTSPSQLLLARSERRLYLISWRRRMRRIRNAPAKQWSIYLCFGDLLILWMRCIIPSTEGIPPMNCMHLEFSHNTSSPMHRLIVNQSASACTNVTKKSATQMSQVLLRTVLIIWWWCISGRSL